MTLASACAAAGRCDGAVARVGVLYAGSLGSPALSAFVAGMANLGYRDGSSATFDFKCANGHSRCHGLPRNWPPARQPVPWRVCVELAPLASNPKPTCQFGLTAVCPPKGRSWVRLETEAGAWIARHMHDVARIVG